MKTLRIALALMALFIGIQTILLLDAQTAYTLSYIIAYRCGDGSYARTAAGCQGYGGCVPPCRPYYFATPPPGLHNIDPLAAVLIKRLDEQFDLDQTNADLVKAFLSKNAATYGGNLQHRFTIAADLARGIFAMNDIFMIWVRDEYIPKVGHTYNATTKTFYSNYPLTLLGDPVYLGTDSYIYFIPRSIIPKAPDGITNMSCDCCYKNSYWWFYTFAYSSTIFNVTMDGEEGVLLYAPAPDTGSTPALK